MIFDPTAIFTALNSFFAFGERLSPAILDWIEAKIPAEKQEVMTHRIRKCKRQCRRQKLPAELIAKEVNLLFTDLDAQQQQEITTLINYDLHPEQLTV